ncbi:hypothetical protein AVEN_206974-1 [Araneus ventricosus]|uniref:Uncharacterized protein n=1 Tax=Araneus ventricosus TaxID=182803 RepID=A0A4Y2X123_ARAVE|nr:hypothetical protein AVEN_197783-1 [Araneus ventricosus]GBO42804.1 hypothetical protein AVEN_33691-1 [Araneus ventricosus]GBO42805.1 hypothetical protein AVEN_186766-1 [Araneus ventricosus]GBO42806.1 hypothetical protein AVEN_206974-1 [Araneus ventricosus]
MEASGMVVCSGCRYSLLHLWHWRESRVPTQILERCRGPVHRLFAGYKPGLQRSSLGSLHDCSDNVQHFSGVLVLEHGAGPSLVKLVQLPFVVGS